MKVVQFDYNNGIPRAAVKIEDEKKLKEFLKKLQEIDFEIYEPQQRETGPGNELKDFEIYELQSWETGAENKLKITTFTDIIDKVTVMVKYKTLKKPERIYHLRVPAKDWKRRYAGLVHALSCGEFLSKMQIYTLLPFNIRFVIFYEYSADIHKVILKDLREMKESINKKEIFRELLNNPCKESYFTNRLKKVMIDDAIPVIKKLNIEKEGGNILQLLNSLGEKLYPLIVREEFNYIYRVKRLINAIEKLLNVVETFLTFMAKVYKLMPLEEKSFDPSVCPEMVKQREKLDKLISYKRMMKVMQKIQKKLQELSEYVKILFAIPFFYKPFWIITLEDDVLCPVFVKAENGFLLTEFWHFVLMDLWSHKIDPEEVSLIFNRLNEIRVLKNLEVFSPFVSRDSTQDDFFILLLTYASEKSMKALFYPIEWVSAFFKVKYSSLKNLF